MREVTKDFILEIEEGGAINVFDKGGGRQVSRISGLMYVNGKPIVINSKALGARELLRQTNLGKIMDFEIEPVKQLTSKTPEFLLLVPKGEKSSDVNDLISELNKKGIKAMCDELPATLKEFEQAADRIMREHEEQKRKGKND